MRADRAVRWNGIGEHAGPKGMPSSETFECAGNRPEEPEMSARTERSAPDIVPPNSRFGALRSPTPRALCRAGRAGFTRKRPPRTIMEPRSFRRLDSPDQPAIRRAP
jgi:hypothetical protein